MSTGQYTTKNSPQTLSEVFARAIRRSRMSHCHIADRADAHRLLIRALATGSSRTLQKLNRIAGVLGLSLAETATGPPRFDEKGRWYGRSSQIWTILWEERYWHATVELIERTGIARGAYAVLGKWLKKGWIETRHPGSGWWRMAKGSPREMPRARRI